MKIFDKIIKLDENNISCVHLPIPITQECYDELYNKGVLKKDELKINSYYFGKCRNANVAMWTGIEFIYMRYKFGSYYVAHINHLSDDNGYDLFVPIKEVEPIENQKIQKKL